MDLLSFDLKDCWCFDQKQEPVSRTLGSLNIKIQSVTVVISQFIHSHVDPSLLSSYHNAMFTLCQYRIVFYSVSTKLK